MADEKPATWKVVVAALLDFFLVFFVGGYLIAALTGQSTPDGFELHGWAALLLFALIILYFWGAKRVGGTLFQRLFGLVGLVR